MRRLFSLFLALSITGPAMAQDMPATEIAAGNRFVAGLDGRVRTLYQSVTNEFLFELQDRDTAEIFSYGMPPSDRNLNNTDVAVLMVASWQEARDLWLGLRIQDLADEAALLVGTNAMSNLSEVTAPDGHKMLIFTFAPNALTPPIPDKCFARMVIDEVYTMSLTDTPFDLESCAAALR